jgi:hypothetical protein
MIPVVRRTPRHAQPRASQYLMPITVLAVLVLVGQMMWLNKHDYMFKPFSIERIRCDNCGGTGVVRDEKDDSFVILCPVCFGVGGHYVRRVDGEDRLCPACSGLGRLDAGDGPRTCKRCDGRGLMREAPWTSRPGQDEK